MGSKRTIDTEGRKRVPGDRSFRRSLGSVVLLLAFQATHSAMAAQASVEEKYDPEFLAVHLAAGETTAGDVEALLGKPYRVERHTSDGVTMQTWRYARHREGVSGMIDRGREAARKFTRFLPQGSRAGSVATDASLAGYRAQDGMENVASLGREDGAGMVLVLEFDGQGLLSRYSLSHDNG